jgi:hypothetical protein
MKLLAAIAVGVAVLPTSGALAQSPAPPLEHREYVPMTDAQYEQGLIPRITFTPIPSLWGHMAGAGSNPADLKFLNEHIATFLNGR